MAIINKDVIAVKGIMDMALAIPDYQRPYKWQAEHVNQLFDDVMHHSEQAAYRLGTLVLCREQHSGKFDIVDGQQRLLTLTLFIDALYRELALTSSATSRATSSTSATSRSTPRPLKLGLLSTQFSSPESIKNLSHNAALLQSRVRRLTFDEQNKLLGFLLGQCELICITLDNLSEAFQFFDSQNARGKPLAPYDLLKAYHLREIGIQDKHAEAGCVEAWELAATSVENNQPSQLQVVMSHHLYRLRRWARGRSGRTFTNQEIGVFKGVNLANTVFPFVDRFRAANYAVDLYNADPARQWDLNQRHFPFQIDQIMVNGRRFFEYIHYYIALHHRLFVQVHPVLQPVLEVLNHYPGKHRTGDGYVRNLFECAVLFYVDKFGEHSLEQVVWLCFFWSYRIRLTHHTVQLITVDNAGSGQGKFDAGLIQVIANALHPKEVLSFMVPMLSANDLDGNQTQVEDLLECFKAKRYFIDAQ